MHFVNLKADNKKHWDKLWDLYEASFPPVERRTLPDHLRAMEDRAFVPLSVW